MKPKKLLDIYKFPVIYGIFQSMSEDSVLNDFFTKLGITDYHAIDMNYYYNRSGLKTASILLQSMIDGQVGYGEFVVNSDKQCIHLNTGERVLYADFIKSINNTLINTYIKSVLLPVWERMYDTFVTEYDPLKSYNLSLEETSGDTLESSGSNTSQGSSSSTSDTTGTINDTDTTQRYTIGISQDPVNYDKDISERSTTDNVEYSDSNNSENSSTYSSNRNITRSVTRSGNMGNRTYTDLLREAIEYYRFNIFDKIYSDLDELLTRAKYI